MLLANIDFTHIFNLRLAMESLPFILTGLPYTLFIAAFGFILGNVVGLFLTLGRLSKFPILRYLVKGYVSFMRGTPMLVFLFILYFGLPFMGIKLSALEAVLIAFVLNSSAYISEVYRAALTAIDKGQWEAAHALGLRYGFIMRKIIFPQAVRVAIPPLGNVALDMIKGTSIAAMITIPDIFQKAKIVGGREFDYMTVYIVVALIYWVLCTTFSKAQTILEKRLAVYD